MKPAFVEPGAMRHVLVLQREVLTPDGMGGAQAEWTALASLEAALEPLAQDSLDQADQTVAHRDLRLFTRFRADVAPGMRLLKDGRTFEIVTVWDPDESGRYLACRLRERLP